MLVVLVLLAAQLQFGEIWKDESFPCLFVQHDLNFWNNVTHYLLSYKTEELGKFLWNKRETL